MESVIIFHKALYLSGGVTFRGNLGVTHLNIILYSKDWDLFCFESINLGNHIKDSGFGR